MKLTGKLKEKVEKAETKAQAKEMIAHAGMELSDEEMDMVSGGVDGSQNKYLKKYTNAPDDGKLRRQQAQQEYQQQPQQPQPQQPQQLREQTIQQLAEQMQATLYERTFDSPR